MAKKKPQKAAEVTTWADLPLALSDALKADRRTQETIAGEIGISQQLISRAQTGKEISPSYAIRIAEHLGIKVEKITAKVGNSESASHFVICCNPQCASLTFAVNEGELYIAPKFRRPRTVQTKTCIYCDSPLVDRCRRCSSPINEKRLTCIGCGFTLVEPAKSLQGLAPDELEEESKKWDRRNRRIQERLRDA